MRAAACEKDPAAVAVWSSTELKYSLAPPSSFQRLANGMVIFPKIPVSEALRWLGRVDELWTDEISRFPS